MTEPNRVLLQPQALVDDRWFEDVDYFHVGSDLIAEGCDGNEFTDDFCLLCEWVTSDRVQSSCALRLRTSVLFCRRVSLCTTPQSDSQLLFFVEVTLFRSTFRSTG